MQKNLKISLAIGLFLIQSSFALAQTSTPQSQEAPAQKAPNVDSFSTDTGNPNTIDPNRFIFEIRPGEKATNSLIITNRSDVDLTFDAYGVDGTLSEQKKFAVKLKSEPQENIGKWVHFDESNATIKPGEQKKFRFTVEIPKGTPLGEYKGGIAAEKSKKDINNPNVNIASRIIKKIDVKVTDNPQKIPLKYKEDMVWPISYLWGSLTLFLISLGVLTWTTLKEKPHKKSFLHFFRRSK